MPEEAQVPAAEEPSGLEELFGEAIDELDAPPAQPQPAPPPPPAPQPSPPPALSQVDREIAQIDAEIAQLTRKLGDEQFKEYISADGNFMQMAYQRDTMRLQQLQNKRTDLAYRRLQSADAAKKWEEYARKKAGDILRGNLGRMPDGMKPKVREVFAGIIREALQTGHFRQPGLQNQAAIEAGLQTLFNLAVGRAYRETQTTSSAATQERGLADEPKPAPVEDDPFEGDEIARAAFERFRTKHAQKQMSAGERYRQQHMQRLGGLRSKEGDE